MQLEDAGDGWRFFSGFSGLGDAAGIKVPFLDPSQDQASTDIGMQYGQRQHIPFGLNQGLQDAADWTAPWHRAGNLINYEAPDLQAGMAHTILYQTLGCLLGRHDPCVSAETSMNGARIVEVDGLPREVGTIVKQKVKSIVVWTGIKDLDEPVVLVLCGFDPEGVNRRVVGGAD